MNLKKKVLITGGAGFIGSHVIRKMVNKYPDYLIVNLDKLTYAGNLNNLNDIENHENYKFENIDINNVKAIDSLFKKYLFDNVIHLAAESHVDRSISNPDDFIITNVLGTLNLLNACKDTWVNSENNCFYHISTDEVYGSLGETGFFYGKHIV
jgi:dTDP-glucose 4,6-dehydratase